MRTKILKPMTQKAQKEISALLKQISEGQLPHRQGDVHCGSLHCVGGWKAVLDYSKAKDDPSILTANFGTYRGTDITETLKKWLDTKLNNNRPVYMLYGSECDYAAMMWKLTTAEAYKLMGANTTSVDWVELLTNWKEGRRYVSGSDYPDNGRWVEYTEFSDYTPIGQYKVDGEGQ